MKQDEYLEDELYRHIKRNGVKGLLPQNLTDVLLVKMNLEADAINEDETEKVSSPALLIAVLHLGSGSEISKNMEMKIDLELLMEYFDLYIVSLRLEDMRQNKVIDISGESLPTLKNIFDSKRSMNITWSR